MKLLLYRAWRGSCVAVRWLGCASLAGCQPRAEAGCTRTCETLVVSVVGAKLVGIHDGNFDGMEQDFVAVELMVDDARGV
jgi:hypothetical protein